MSLEPLRCAHCNETLSAEWDVCPYCTASVTPACPECGQPVQSRWKLCPKCKTVLRGDVSNPFLTVVGDGAGVSSGATAAGGSSAPVLNQGSQLGKYRIERALGTGAYGAVYAVHNPDTDEVIALKAVGTFGDAEALRAAVAAEWKIQRGLRDKAHILESYPPEVVEAFGLRWVLLPMELAKGTLRGWLRAKAAKPEHLEEGLALLRQAVAGLLVLHEAGIVHRDVKPENLLLVSSSGAAESGGVVVKVGDFGLACGLEKLASERPELLGDGIGTPAYMAPEQVLAAHWKDVTAAADAYAVGTILFEMLDGERPYSGTAEQLRAKKRDPRLVPRTPLGPPHLRELVLQLLSPTKENRVTLEAAAPRLVRMTPSDFAQPEQLAREKVTLVTRNVESGTAPQARREQHSADPEPTQTAQSASKAKKGAPKKKPMNKANAAFMKPVQPDAVLAAIVGDKPMPRTKIMEKVWAYIKKNDLQDKQNLRQINADGKLKALFGGKSSVTMFEMTKYIFVHAKES